MTFGVLETAALVALIAGAGVQAQASSNAQKRQAQEIRKGLDRQRELQLEAEKKALDLAQGFKTEDRVQEQTGIADQITQDLIAPVSESQAIRSEQQSTAGNVSDDFKAAKAKSDLETIKSTEKLARLLGKQASASRLRQNEGVRFLDTGQAIDQLGGFSRGNQAVDQLAVQQAGQVNPGTIFLGSVLQSLGAAGLAAGASSAASSGTGLTASSGTGLTASTGSGTNIFQAGSGGGLGLTAGGGTGFRLPTAGGLPITGF